MTGTTLPAAVTNLRQILNTALPDLQQIDGPAMKQRRRQTLRWFAAADGPAPVALKQTWAGSGSMSRNETYTLPLVLELWTGSTDQAKVVALRDETFTTFSAIETALRSDPSLGITGKTLRAQLTGGGYEQLQETQGLLCRIEFTVTVEARI